VDERQFGSGPPLTPGREFAVQPLWNLTVDGTYTDTSDHRHGVDIDGHGANVTVGLDRLLTGSLVAGANLSIAYNHTKQFHGISKSESIGLTLSPYAAFEILPHWTLNISPGFGWTQNENAIGPLDASYTSLTYSGSVSASGDYNVLGFSLRPTLSAYYAHTDNEAYSTTGTVRGRFISLRTPRSSFNFGVADVSLEVNRTFTTPGGMPLVPYIEVGASYEFERPNDGKIRTRDLEFVDSTPWSGLVRVGLRAMLTSSTFIEAKAAYLSLGVKDLDIWEFGLFLSHGF
jgi:outer membrane autotransporter protein